MDKKSILLHLLEIIVCIAIIAGIFGYYNDKLDVSEQNLKAFIGKLEEAELKNSNLLVSRDSYITTINDLENLLSISKKEVKEIQRKLDSKLAYIAELESNTKIEYIEVVKDSIIYVTNDSLIAKFHYNDEWFSFNGETKFQFKTDFDYNTIIRDITINMPLTVGLTDDYKIFVTTPNPYVNFSSIEGAVIDNPALRPKKKRFGWGLQLGFGAMYDVIDKDVAVGPYAGLGVELNF